MSGQGKPWRSNARPPPPIRAAGAAMISTPSSASSPASMSPFLPAPALSGDGAAVAAALTPASGVATPSSSSSEAILAPMDLAKVAIPRLEGRNDRIQRQRTLRACVPCRDRKTKCDGHTPTCRQCRMGGYVCSWAWSKRERKELELESARSKVNAYEALLGEIMAKSRADNLTSIEEIFSRHVRASPDVFANLLASQPLLHQHLPGTRPGISLNRMHLAWNTREGTGYQPLCLRAQVQTSQIQRWTTFVDNETASHLLSLYFAWENPIWHLVDEYMFLHDLETGGTRFCSSLLVHTVLFYGVSTSYDLGEITNRREEKYLGKRLYDEIQRQWQLDKTNATLPTAQASILIGMLCCTFGIDRIGTRYILHGAELAQKFGLNRARAEYFSIDDPELAGPVAHCQKLVAWAFLDIQSLVAQVYRKGPVWLERPLVRFEAEEAAALDEGIDWSPYPFMAPAYPALYFTASYARSELVEIVHQIALFAQRFPASPIGPDEWKYGWDLYRRLLHWRANMPAVLSTGTTPCPHILCLHMYFHASTASLCDIFNLHPDATTRDSAMLAEFSPQDVKSQAMEALGSLVLLYKHHHGFKSNPIVMLHYFCVAGVHAISQLRVNRPKWSMVLESSVVGLWYMSLGWGRLCVAFLRTIQLVFKSAQIDPKWVPPKVLQIFHQLDQNLWTARDISSLAADYVVLHIPDHLGEQNRAGAGYRSEGLEALINSLDNMTVL